MGYTNQAQHKPSARPEKRFNYYKLYKYEALYQRIIEGRNASYGTNIRKINFPTQYALDGVVVLLLLL
jgi:hypothetical protein